MSLLLAAGAAAPITGTLSATCGNATLAASGKVVVSGVLAATGANATLAASGKVTVSGVLASTVANSTFVATGVVITPPAEGVLASTVGDFSAAIRGAAYSNAPKRSELAEREIQWLRGLFQPVKAEPVAPVPSEKAPVISDKPKPIIIPLTTASDLAELLAPKVERVESTPKPTTDDADLVAAIVAVATARQRAFHSRRAA